MEPRALKSLARARGLSTDQSAGQHARGRGSFPASIAAILGLFVLLLASPDAEANNCFKGKQCGNTCISEWKTCRIAPVEVAPAPIPAPLPEVREVVAAKPVEVAPLTRSGHLMSEKEYQHEMCTAWLGEEEFTLDDHTRVDCLTADLAVEFDFAEKWAESLGQALHYGRKTGRAPTIALIIESPADLKYLDHLIELKRFYRLNVQIKKIMKPEVAKLLRESQR